MQNSVRYSEREGEVSVGRSSYSNSGESYGARSVLSYGRFFTVRKSGKRATYTTGVKARIASGPRLALIQDISVINYWGAVAIAQVAMFYGMRIKPITGVQHA